MLWKEVRCIPLIVMPSYLTNLWGTVIFVFVIAKNWIFCSVSVLVGSKLVLQSIPHQPQALFSLNAIVTIQHKYSLYMVHFNRAEVFRVQLFCSLFLQLVVSEGV